MGKPETVQALAALKLTASQFEEKQVFVVRPLELAQPARSAPAARSVAPRSRSCQSAPDWPARALESTQTLRPTLSQRDTTDRPECVEIGIGSTRAIHDWSGAMLVSLQIVSGTQSGTRIQLKSGQVARFGRTEWADFAFPGDAAMADVHFELDCGPRSCTVRDLGSGQATEVNGQPVQETPLLNGQRITAGGTTFVVAMDPPPTVPRSESAPLAAAGLPEPAETPLAVPAPPQVPLDAVQLCQKLKLDEAAARLAVPQQSGVDFAVALLAAGEHAAAMRVLAYWLPKRKAVWWGAQCLRATVPDAATSGLIAAAEAWVQKPTDENGRAAQAAALAAPFDGPAHWVALAAFWSGPSLGPPDAPPLPPDDLLTSQGVTGALMLAATQPPARMAADRYHKFLTLGQDVAQKKLAWET